MASFTFEFDCDVDTDLDIALDSPNRDANIERLRMALIRGLEGETIRDPDTFQPLGVIDSAAAR
jgi:hypothetical protein